MHARNSRFAVLIVLFLSLASAAWAWVTVDPGAFVIPAPGAVAALTPVSDTGFASLQPCDDTERACVNEAPSMSDIAGVWRTYFRHPIIQPPGGLAFLRFTTDGRFIMADTAANTVAPYAPYPSGRFTLEDGVLTFLQDEQIVIAECTTGTYAVSLYYFGARPVALAHSLIEDYCPGRPEDSAVPKVWVSD